MFDCPFRMLVGMAGGRLDDWSRQRSLSWWLTSIIMSCCSCGMYWLLNNVNGSVSDVISVARVVKLGMLSAPAGGADLCPTCDEPACHWACVARWLSFSSSWGGSFVYDFSMACRVHLSSARDFQMGIISAPGNPQLLNVLMWSWYELLLSSVSSSSNFIPNRIQQYNRMCMTNITNNRVIIDIVMWFCWWPPEKPWAYQAGSSVLWAFWILNGSSIVISGMTWVPKAPWSLWVGYTILSLLLVIYSPLWDSLLRMVHCYSDISLFLSRFLPL